MNDETVKEWITVNGNHIPIHEGETKQEAVEAFLHDKRKKGFIEIKPRMVLNFSNVTKKEWSKWYSALGEINRGMWYPHSNGAFAIQIGKKVFMTSGTYESPVLDKIYEFNSTRTAELFIERIYKK